MDQVYIDIFDAEESCRYRRDLLICVVVICGDGCIIAMPRFCIHLAPTVIEIA